MDKLFEDIKNNNQSRPIRAFEDVEKITIPGIKDPQKS